MKPKMPGNNQGGDGYGKPPKEYQFKPGQSGNPNGRPKRKLPTTLQSAASQLMEEIVSLKVNGKPTKMSRAQILIAKTFVDANRGDKGALRELRQLTKLPPAPDRAAELLGTADRLRAKFATILERQRRRKANEAVSHQADELRSKTDNT